MENHRPFQSVQHSALPGLVQEKTNSPLFNSPSIPAMLLCFESHSCFGRSTNGGIEEQGYCGSLITQICLAWNSLPPCVLVTSWPWHLPQCPPPPTHSHKEQSVTVFHAPLPWSEECWTESNHLSLTLGPESRINFLLNRGSSWSANPFIFLPLFLLAFGE